MKTIPGYELNEITILHCGYTLLIKITFPLIGDIRVASMDCLISGVRSPSAMRALHETLLRSMKHTCPKPHWHMRVRIALQLKSGVLDWKFT